MKAACGGRHFIVTKLKGWVEQTQDMKSAEQLPLSSVYTPGAGDKESPLVGNDSESCTSAWVAGFIEF